MMILYIYSCATSTKAKRYQAHGCEERDYTFIENPAGRNDEFSEVPASA